ncbi:MAG: hypothetical protein JWM55_554 [Acidimicrobiaceae bacterium]|nr:hypothetical protein [Acidimicrobiaceae bacterium]
MAITRVQIVSVPVTDQDHALQSYVGILGLEVLHDSPMGPEMRWVQIAPAGAQTTLSPVTWFPTTFDDPDGNGTILGAADTAN